jgi:hypothetical protein
MIIEKEDILAFEIHEGIVCEECIDKEEVYNIKQNEIITEKEVEINVLLFSDRCNELINVEKRG